MNTKVDRKGQIVMSNTDTDLSQAADTFIASEAILKEAKDDRQIKMDALINLMREKKINKLNHDGDILVVRKGHITRDVIAFSRG